MFEKIANAICWVVVGILTLFVLVVGVARVVGLFFGFKRLFTNSPLPWWILVPAAIAMIAGFIYLLRNKNSRVPPNQKFLG